MGGLQGHPHPFEPLFGLGPEQILEGKNSAIAQWRLFGRKLVKTILSASI